MFEVDPIKHRRLQLPRFLREPFEDVTRKRPSSGVNYDVLDGFRGLAVLIVLTDHAGVLHNEGRGFDGVMMFFVLSGFLLSLAFNRPTPPVAPTWSFIKEFLGRRMRRIYPLYILFIFLSFYPLASVNPEPFDYGTAWNRFRFFLGYATFAISGGHFWTIAQEVYFYVLLPLVFLVNHYVFREKKLAIFAWLLVGAYLWWGVAADQTILLLRFNIEYFPNAKQLYFDAFMVGVGSCYLAYGLGRSERLKGGSTRAVTSLVGFVSTVFLVFSSNHHINLYVGPYSSALAELLQRAEKSFPLSLVSATLILCLLLNRNGVLAKAFNNLPLRLIGVLGYSMYLVHPPVIAALEYFAALPKQAETRFFLVFALSLLISCVTYTYIEKPFMNGSALRSLRSRFRHKSATETTPADSSLRSEAKAATATRG